eukprot:TRINITY_DN21314_c0_g1_i1.p2 TRINITY_DN21314_c0_g1~~TRINITY_DN21314_c0_g1_i1.p2  ORF type:complete len:280 (+),score=74.51 TRINITY_DN21314_c0_g1_i1:96-935(+)
MPEGVDWATHSVITLLAAVPPVFLTCPLDVLKTRRQSTRREALSSTARSLWQREGLRGAQLGSWLTFTGYTLAPAVKMYTYTALSLVGVESPTLRGIVSGGVTAVATCPIWVLKVRTQLQPTLSTRDVLRQTLRLEGWRGLYTGLGAACLNKGLEYCVFFSVYEASKAYAHIDSSLCTEVSQLDLTGISTSAGFARFCASVAAYPVSVLTTRLREPSSWGTAKPVWQQVREMVLQRAAFSGLLPHVCRVVPFASLYFACYEILLARARPSAADASALQV